MVDGSDNHIARGIAARDAPSQSWTQNLLLEPIYGFGTSSPRSPTLREVVTEWLDAVAFWRDFTRLLPAAHAAYHVATFAVFLVLLARFLSITNMVIVLTIAGAIGMLYNTVWYHRYCSHRAFKFRNLWLARLFLWTNPIGFREESYAIPHRIHHSQSDTSGDPYGPHLGRLGSYLATESQQKTNRNLSLEDYRRLCQSLDHIGFVKNSYEQYRLTGSVENVWHFGVRMAFANLFWIFAAYAIGQLQGVVIWFSAVFLYSFMVRDFNYRGHGGAFYAARQGRPINQIYYGVVAGEWHENHHTHPGLARSGLEWWQVDVPFWIIKLLSMCGAVVHYNSHAQNELRQPRDPRHLA